MGIEKEKAGQAEETLKKQFGYKAFLPGQREITEAILAGRDVLGVMPPGSGKALCVKLSSCLTEGFTLVITPRVNRMPELVRDHCQAGIPAAYLNENMPGRQFWATLRNVWQGHYRVLYVTPEKLGMNEIRDLAKGLDISLVVVEEAQCISPLDAGYSRSCSLIPDFLVGLKKRPVFAAFSPVSSPLVQKDICRRLGLDAPLVVAAGFARPDLSFFVTHTEDKDSETLRFIERHEGEKGVIFCAGDSKAESLARLLRSHGIKAGTCHAELLPDKKQETINAFRTGRLPVLVISALSVPEMPLGDPGFILHYNMPESIETYIKQSWGAAPGRVGTECHILYSPSDVENVRSSLQKNNRTAQMDPENAADAGREDEQRLHEMIRYCLSRDCLSARLKSYFGEPAGEPCGRCGNCLSGAPYTDMTEEARRIVDCIFEVHEKCGLETVIRILKGSRSGRMRERHLDRLHSFGRLSRIKSSALRSAVDELIQEEIIQLSDSLHPVLELGEKWEKMRESSFHILVRRD